MLGQLSVSPDTGPLAMPTWLPPLLKREASPPRAALPLGLVSPRPQGLLLCVSDRPPVTPIASLYFIDSLSLHLIMQITPFF